jgi:hypothetical protein
MENNISYFKKMIPVMELIRDDKNDEALQLSEKVRNEYKWDDESMNVDSVEIMNSVQEYMHGLGDIKKQDLLALFWNEIGHKYLN